MWANATQNLFGRPRWSKSLPTTVGSLNHPRALTDVSWSCSGFKTLAGCVVKVEPISSPASTVASTLAVLRFCTESLSFSWNFLPSALRGDSHRSAPACWAREEKGENWWREKTRMSVKTEIFRPLHDRFVTGQWDVWCKPISCGGRHDAGKLRPLATTKALMLNLLWTSCHRRTDCKDHFTSIVLFEMQLLINICKLFTHFDGE